MVKEEPVDTAVARGQGIALELGLAGREGAEPVPCPIERGTGGGGLVDGRSAGAEQGGGESEMAGADEYEGSSRQGSAGGLLSGGGGGGGGRSGGWWCTRCVSWFGGVGDLAAGEADLVDSLTLSTFAVIQYAKKNKIKEQNLEYERKTKECEKKEKETAELMKLLEHEQTFVDTSSFFAAHCAVQKEELQVDEREALQEAIIQVNFGF